MSDVEAERELSSPNKLRKRTDVNEFLFWVLLSVNRWALVAVLALGIFTTFMLFGVFKSVSLLSMMETSDMVETVFSGLVGAIITSTTSTVTTSRRPEIPERKDMERGGASP